MIVEKKYNEVVVELNIITEAVPARVLDLILETFRKVKDKAVSKNFCYSDKGICHVCHRMLAANGTVTYGSTLVFEIVSCASQAWSEYSGVMSYPVKENPDLNRWEGENLETRIRLLYFLIAVLERYLDISKTD